MQYIEFSVEKPVKYMMTGKLKTPSPEWTHLDRDLYDYELIFVTEGIVYIKIDQKEYTLKKGEFLLCPPYVHQKGFKSSENCHYWLHFWPHNIKCSEDFKRISVLSTSNHIKLPVHGEVQSFEKIIVMMKQLQDAVRTYRDSNLSNYLSTAILCELYNQCSREEKDKKDINREQIYNDILDYIKWYRHTNLKVKDIASHFGYNEKYLSHVFHSIKGMTLKQYILQEKIELAKYILTDTNDTVTSVAEQLGFNDSHNFMKVFKKQVGLTPTEYRNTYGKRLLYYI